uniref:Uncharacterized protein n=1 Tax=Magallana gigas TaxID=29159 RepID=A0A8W8NTN3_MAGGI
MGEEIDGLGVSLFHDASPSVKKLACRESAALQSPELLKDGTDVPSSLRTAKDIFKGRAKLKKRAPCQPSQQQSLKCKKKTSIYIFNQDRIWHIMCSRYSMAKTWF